MRARDLLSMAPWDAEEESWNVIVETAQGSRNKFKYDAASGSFVLSKVLPLGMSFPYDFGFLPCTQGEDGDPLDVLVFLDEPAFAGCRVLCRMVGVITAKQTEQGESEENDRLIAIARESQLHQGIRSLKNLPPSLSEEIEHFFVSYNAMVGKQFQPLGRYGPRRAEKVIRRGMKRYQREKRETKWGKVTSA
jgi:inorganic pyrophosphatase